MQVSQARIDGPPKSQLRDLRLHFIPTEDRNATRRLFRATIMPAFFIFCSVCFERGKRDISIFCEPSLSLPAAEINVCTFLASDGGGSKGRRRGCKGEPDLGLRRRRRRRKREGEAGEVQKGATNAAQVCVYRTQRRRRSDAKSASRTRCQPQEILHAGNTDDPFFPFDVFGRSVGGADSLHKTKGAIQRRPRMRAGVCLVSLSGA